MARIEKLGIVAGTAVALAGSAVAQAADNTFLWAQDRASQQRESTAVALRFTLPLGHLPGQGAAQFKPRMALTLQSRGADLGRGWRDPASEFGVGLTFDGQGFISRGHHLMTVEEIDRALRADEADGDAEPGESSGGNTALFIVGGVLLGGVAIAELADGLEDTGQRFGECIADALIPGAGPCTPDDG